MLLAIFLLTLISSALGAWKSVKHEDEHQLSNPLLSLLEHLSTEAKGLFSNMTPNDLRKNIENTKKREDANLVKKREMQTAPIYLGLSIYYNPDPTNGLTCEGAPTSYMYNTFSTSCYDSGDGLSTQVLVGSDCSVTTTTYEAPSCSGASGSLTTSTTIGGFFNMPNTLPNVCVAGFEIGCSASIPVLSGNTVTYDFYSNSDCNSAGDGVLLISITNTIGACTYSVYHAKTFLDEVDSVDLVQGTATRHVYDSQYACDIANASPVASYTYQLNSCTNTNGGQPISMMFAASSVYVSYSAKQ